MPDDAPAPLARSLASAGLAALLGAAGVMHFARPRTYEPLIPGRLGHPRAWVLASGAAELACAVAIAIPRTRRTGSLAAAALFVAVFPGNVQMAVDSRSDASSWVHRPGFAWGRLPFQLPLVAWAVAVARGARR